MADTFKNRSLSDVFCTLLNVKCQMLDTLSAQVHIRLK